MVARGEGPLTTRVATPADAVDVARLNALFNGSSLPPEGIAAQIAAASNIERAILAEIDGRVIGYACVRLVPIICSDEPYAELTELFVEADWRRHGAGRALMAHAELLAAKYGASELLLMTGFRNQEAQAFYRALGYTDRCLVMSRGIEAQGT